MELQFGIYISRKAVELIAAAVVAAAAVSLIKDLVYDEENNDPKINPIEG